MVSCLLGLCIYVLFASAAAHGSPGDSCPRHRGLPEGFAKGNNSFRDRALYRLDLRHALHGYTPDEVYKFRVHTTVRKVKFNDATITIKALNPECGVGELLVDNDKLYSPKGCPDVVSTQQKEPMGRAHFRWRAPSCGCVHIRVRIHADSVYYLEDENVHNGALARTVCSEEIMKKLKMEAAIRKSKIEDDKQNWREAKFEKLCKASRKFEMENVLKSDSFLNRRLIRIADEFELDRLNIALEQRKSNTIQCCDLGGSQMLECFGDVRRRRIDSFCGTGEPEVPFSKSRYDWIKQRESECCWQIGEARYTCFNYTLYRENTPHDHGDTTAPSVVSDLDDFDPANDFEDFSMSLTTKRDKKTEKTKTERTKPEEKDTTESVPVSESVTDKAKPTKTNVASKRTNHKISATKHKHSKTVSDDDLPERDDLEDSDTTGNVQSDSEDEDEDENDDVSSEVTESPQVDRLSTRKYENDEDSEDEEDRTTTTDPDETAPVGAVSSGSTLVTAPIDPNRTFSDMDCSMHGVTAGTIVADKGRDGCFSVADKFNHTFTRWNRRCDRLFVMYCMRVIDGYYRFYETEEFSKQPAAVNIRPAMIFRDPEMLEAKKRLVPGRPFDYYKAGSTTRKELMYGTA